MAPKKAMSDGEVNEMAFKSLMGDLDKIEADGMFNESEQPRQNEGTKIETNGMSIHIKPMNGEQTEDMPKMEDDDDADKRPVKLGL